MPAEALLRATAVAPRGTWQAEPIDCVVLGFDDRHRRRLRMRGVRGTAFLLDLADTTRLRGGDALRLANGELIEIVAAAEPLVEISCATAASLARIAWHLGNRHLPLQISGSRIRIRCDHVIEDMVRGLGGAVRLIEAPFDPEDGAYAAGGHEHHGVFHRHD